MSWENVLIALLVEIPSIITAAGAVYLGWVNLRKIDHNTSKLDHNTRLTEEGALAATLNARVAAEAATEAKTVAADTKSVTLGIDRKLNGGIDRAIQEAIKPIQAAVEEHTVSDSASFEGIDKKFAALTEYVHQRNHDLLDAINAMNLKITLLLKEKGCHFKEDG